MVPSQIPQSKGVHHNFRSSTPSHINHPRVEHECVDSMNENSLISLQNGEDPLERYESPTKYSDIHSMGSLRPINKWVLYDRRLKVPTSTHGPGNLLSNPYSRNKQCEKGAMGYDCQHLSRAGSDRWFRGTSACQRSGHVRVAFWLITVPHFGLIKFPFPFHQAGIDGRCRIYARSMHGIMQ